MAAALRRLRRRAARERSGPPLSYRELAARTGWAYGSFSGYFRGGVLPPADRLDTLLQLLGASDVEQAALIATLQRWAGVPATGAASAAARAAVAAQPLPLVA